MADAAIEFDGLSKRFGKVEAVKDLSFSVEFGRVTGFLGPNGAGKSTTLRMLLGLIHPNAGTATFGGRATSSCRTRAPTSARCSRRRASIPGAAAATTCACSPPPAAIRTSRVQEVLEQVDIAGAADRRVKGYSMGMRQRLAIAAALLGDPDVLILDEPANGLDPPGIRWMRDLLRSEAARGRAVLVSSHLLREVSQSVDDVVVISHGVLRGSGPLESVLGGADGPVTRVRAAEADRLATLLREQGHVVERGRVGRAAGARRRARGRRRGRRRPAGRALRAGRGLALAGGRVLRADRGRGMTALLRAELIKLRTTRTFIALTGVAVGTSLLICVLVSLLSEPTEEYVLTDVFTADTSGLFIVILAIVGITGEWRHRTITSSLLAAPDRLRFLAAKTLAFAAAGLLLSLLISISIAIVGMIILSARDLPTPELGELVGQIIRNAEVAALLGAFGLALGTLVRNQPVAIVGVLMLLFVIEPTAGRARAGRGPLRPVQRPVRRRSRRSPPRTSATTTSTCSRAAWPVLAMLAWIGACRSPPGAVLLRRRDLN